MKIRILYIIDKMKPAGAQNHLAGVVSGLDKTKFEARVITLEELGVKRIYDLSGARGLFRLVKLMRREKFDIIQTYLFSENILGVLAAKLAGARLIITGRRDTGMLREGKWQHILAYKLTNPAVTRVVCVSQAVRRVVLEKERLDPAKAVVIYNGVDVERFGEGRRKREDQGAGYRVQGTGYGDNTRTGTNESLGVRAGEFVVGMIANFSWIKGHEVLLKAAPEIIKEVPCVKFVLAGDGVLLETIKSEAKKAKIDNNFLFLGKRTDIAELLAVMDVSLNLSYSEGMSNTILESMAAGVPVVATAVDGNLETVVDGQAGILVLSGDARATASSVIRLFKDKNLRKLLGENARRMAREKFDSKIMINRMERLYVELTGKGGAKREKGRGKIAFIFSQFPCYDETFILREMNALSASGLKLEIYSLKPLKDKIVHKEAEGLTEKTSYLPFFSFKLLLDDLFFLVRHPFRYLCVFFQAGFFNLKSPDFFFKTCAVWYKAMGFARLARRQGVTHVHGQWATFPATVAYIISKLNNIPFSFTGHAHDIYLDTTMLGFKLRRAKFVVTCTQDNKRYLEKIATGDGRRVKGKEGLTRINADQTRIDANKERGAEIEEGRVKNENGRGSNANGRESGAGDKIIVSYHGVDLGRFCSEDRVEKGKDGLTRINADQTRIDANKERKFRILSVGSLLECKGFEYLIEACGMLKEKGIDLECVIAGGGRLEQSLKSQAASANLQERINFTGYITQDKLLPFYREADVFVLAMVPDKHWGIPNVLIEAFACSVPVICTMLPSIPELVEDGKTGFIIPAKDPAAIAVAAERLYSDRALRERMGRAGRQVVEEKFDVAKNASRLMELYEE